MEKHFSIQLFSISLVISILGFGLAELPKFPSNDVSVTNGQQLYSNYCASCHGDNAKGGSQSKLNFTSPAWSKDYSPAEIVNIALGVNKNHPAALKDSQKAWDVTAYLWTLPLSSNVIKEGQSEVEKAASLMKKGGIAFLISKGGEIKELENVNWIMQHKESDIVKLIKDLAADQYNALNQEHQQALIDYIYASHFKLPSGW